MSIEDRLEDRIRISQKNNDMFEYNFYTSILNMLKEKEFEIQRLKKYEKYYATEINLFDKYISKDRIIAKMEELNKKIKTEEVFEAIFNIKQQQVLQELLKQFLV